MMKQIQVAYDQIAEQFAIINTSMPPELSAVAERFLMLAKPGSYVLDIGCGPGRDIAWFETRHTNVIGIDLSAGMLTQARLQIQGELLQMDMSHLGFRTASFQGVWCNASLLHLPKYEAFHALTEIHRILVPGGVLFLGIQAGTGETWEEGPYGTVKRLFVRYSPAEMTTLLTQIGFAIQEYASHQISPSRCWLHFLAISGLCSEEESRT